MGCSYIKITNSDDKTWILQSHNLSMAFNLYQPSATKGALLKKYLPVIARIPFIKNFFYSFLGVKVLKKYSECGFLVQICEEIFKTRADRIDLNFFLGTPSRHRKITVQISTGIKILGYCRLSDSLDLWEMFVKEKDMLDYLNNKGIIGIPKCLLCEDFGGNGYLFIQSTNKTQESVSIHNFTELQIVFLKELFEKTKVTCRFSDTDYAAMLCKLCEFVEGSGDDILDDKTKVNLLNAIALVRVYMQAQTEFCVYHGDFTPWNMFVESGALFVFDFEYAKRSYPKYLDAFHFLMQTCIFEKNSRAEKILHMFEQEDSIIRDLFKEDWDVMLLTYMLDILHLYLTRDYGCYTAEVVDHIQLRLEIVERLVNRLR